MRFTKHSAGVNAMVVIFGRRLMGKCDQVPGLFHVATQFFHINFVPLVPVASWVVLSENGTQFRGVQIPMTPKSVFLTWGRFITCVAAIVAIVPTIVAFNNPSSSTEWLLPAAIAVTCAVSFVFLRWHKFCTRASYNRACQLAQLVGLNPAGFEMIQKHYGQSAGRGFEVMQQAPFIRATQPASAIPPRAAQPVR